MEGEGRIFVNDWRVLAPSTCPTVSQARELRAPGGRGGEGAEQGAGAWGRASPGAQWVQAARGPPSHLAGSLRTGHPNGHPSAPRGTLRVTSVPAEEGTAPMGNQPTPWETDRV